MQHLCVPPGQDVVDYFEAIDPDAPVFGSKAGIADSM